MADLIAMYEGRLHGYEIETAKDLKSLLDVDEKAFYFALMYFFLIRKQLGSDIFMDASISNQITLFCMSVNDQDIIDYYSQFVNLTEVPEQISKIYREYKVRDKKEEV